MKFMVDIGVMVSMAITLHHGKVHAGRGLADDFPAPTDLTCPAPTADNDGDFVIQYIIIDNAQIMGPCKLSHRDSALLVKAAEAKYSAARVRKPVTFANQNCVFVTRDEKTGVISGRFASDISSARKREAEEIRLGEKVIRGTVCK